MSVVVVNHHTPDLLAACIRSLSDGSRRPDEIIVVDNEVLADEPRQDWTTPVPIKVVRRASNPGYAASCNTGAALATGQMVLFLNADVTVSVDCLQQCVDAIVSDPGIGIVTCRLERPDGSLDHACHRGLPTPFASLAYVLRLDRAFPGSRSLGRYRMTWLDPAADHDIEACTGAFLLTRRSILDEVGGWDERYWFYGEDLDLCVRVARTGSRVRYLGTVKATHVKGASSHLREPDSALEPHELAAKRRVQAAIIDSHELFFSQHLAPRASWLERVAARLLFATQRRLHHAAS